MPFQADVCQSRLAKDDLYLPSLKILHLSSLTFSPISLDKTFLTIQDKECVD